MKTLLKEHGRNVSTGAEVVRSTTQHGTQFKKAQLYATTTVVTIGGPDPRHGRTAQVVAGELTDNYEGRNRLGSDPSFRVFDDPCILSSRRLRSPVLPLYLAVVIAGRRQRCWRPTLRNHVAGGPARPLPLGLRHLCRAAAGHRGPAHALPDRRGGEVTASWTFAFAMLFVAPPAGCLAVVVSPRSLLVDSIRIQVAVAGRLQRLPVRSEPGRRFLRRLPHHRVGAETGPTPHTSVAHRRRHRQRGGVRSSTRCSSAWCWPSTAACRWVRCSAVRSGSTPAWTVC